MTPHPTRRLMTAPVAVPPLPCGEGNCSLGACAPREEDLFPSPRGEGGPRRAFSPAVAGRMRGHFRRLDHVSACPHNPPVSTLTGGAIPTLNSRPADDVETTSGETVPDSEFSD